jgi:hypothetical protein
MNRTDFQQLADLRVREAEALRHAGHFEGAYYLLGYAVECALKACFATQIQQFDFPDRGLVNAAYTHNLENLLVVSGVKSLFDTAVVANRKLKNNWTTVTDWKEDARYRANVSQVAVDSLFDAVLHLTDGVLTWLRTLW